LLAPCSEVRRRARSICKMRQSDRRGGKNAVYAGKPQSSRCSCRWPADRPHARVEPAPPKGGFEHARESRMSSMKTRRAPAVKSEIFEPREQDRPKKLCHSIRGFSASACIALGGVEAAAANDALNSRCSGTDLPEKSATPHLGLSVGSGMFRAEIRTSCGQYSRRAKKPAFAGRGLSRKTLAAADADVRRRGPQVLRPW